MLLHPVHYAPAGDSFPEWCLSPNQVNKLICLSPTIYSCCIVCIHLLLSHVISASCCWVWAVDSDASSDREKSLELIRFLVPDVLNGALVDSLSGHALSAAGLAASFLLEGNEQARLPAPPISICSVIKAQKPGWSLMSHPGESCYWKPFFISGVYLSVT